MQSYLLPLAAGLTLTSCASYLPAPSENAPGLREAPLVGEWTVDELALLSWPQAWAVAAGDLTGDGAVEILLDEDAFGLSKLAMYSGVAGTEVAEIWFRDSMEAEIADVDGDGVDDLVATNYTTGSLAVFYGPLTGSYEDADADATYPGPCDRVAAGDVDGDGLANPICGYDDTLFVLEDAPSGTVQLGEEALVLTPQEDDELLLWGGTFVADLDGDGENDLAAPAREPDGVFVWRGPIAPGAHPELLQPTRPIADNDSWDHSALAPDLTGDGLPDLLLSDSMYREDGFRGRVVVFSGLQEAAQIVGRQGDYVGDKIVVVPDLDEDGFAELAMGSNILDEDPSVQVLYGPLVGDITLDVPPARYAEIHGAATPRLAGDVDGDGFSELVVQTTRFWFDEDNELVVLDGDPSPKTTDPLPVWDLTVGDLVVTEIMANPWTCTDDTGEWIEIYNASGVEVDLDGLVLRDQANTTGEITGSAVVAAGAYAVLGRGDPSTWCSTEVTPTAFYGSAPWWNNGGDQVVLEDGTGRELDRSAIWDSALAASGVSAALQQTEPDATTNDDLSSWAQSTAPLGSELGTPGAPNF